MIHPKNSFLRIISHSSYFIIFIGNKKKRGISSFFKKYENYSVIVALIRSLDSETTRVVGIIVLPLLRRNAGSSRIISTSEGFKILVIINMDYKYKKTRIYYRYVFKCQEKNGS